MYLESGDSVRPSTPPHPEGTTSLKWWEKFPPMENLIESDLVNCHLWKVENPNAKWRWWWNIGGTILENCYGGRARLVDRPLASVVVSLDSTTPARSLKAAEQSTVSATPSNSHPRLGPVRVTQDGSHQEAHRLQVLQGPRVRKLPPQDL